MYLYEITNSETSEVYVGITRGSIKARWNSHKNASKRYNWSLYSAINKHGIDKFTISVVAEYETEADLLEAERERIKLRRKENLCYNVLNGGASYFSIKDKKAWKEKLRVARKGRTPALGMNHTEENKKLFSECSKRRWDLSGRYPDISNLSFKEATSLYGISKTHYYRLKRAKNSELG